MTINLLIDSGNTCFKWATVDEFGQLTKHSVFNEQLSEASLRSAWSELERPEQIAYSSVSATAILAWVQTVATVLWPEVPLIVARSEAQAFGVCNAYQQPEKLGVDRWLALIATHHYYPGPACIVDCGTAITVDLMNEQGQHQGGLISPGLRLMRQSLAQGTANLAFDNETYETGLSNFTAAAIHNGTLFAAVGLITQVLNTQAEATPLILTGGDAEHIVPHLSVNATLDTDLVLRGLAVLLQKKAA